FRILYFRFLLLSSFNRYIFFSIFLCLSIWFLLLGNGAAASDWTAAARAVVTATLFTTTFFATTIVTAVITALAWRITSSATSARAFTSAPSSIATVA